jgi:A/G-specific adenine glycosylase
LLTWYGRHARDLPWRRTKDPYRIWLSEIMLQQTQVATVLPYYRRFLKALPTVKTLAKASEDEVFKLWEGLGYYSRARNLMRAAAVVVGELEGKFPDTVEGLMALPGVGRYTAGAIASVAFGRAAPVVDGNVKRVYARLLGIRRPLNQAAAQDRLWRIAEELLPARRAGDFNQALMDLGATICRPRQPACDECPIGRLCDARRAGDADRLPVRMRRKALPHYAIVAGLIERRGRYLIGRRPAGGLLGGLWELPGGKVEAGETRAAALQREIREEVGLAIAVGSHVASVYHAYSHMTIDLHVYRCTVSAGRCRPHVHTELKWITPAQFSRYAFPAANRKVFASVKL